MSKKWFAAVALLSIALTGCSSLGGGRNFFAKGEGHKQSVARKNLNNPGRLDLAYAKWQEQIGNLTEARERYQRVLGDEPHSLEATLGLARLDQLAGRVHEAEQGYRKALKVAPNDPLVLDAMGQFYATQEKWPLAIDTLKQALNTTPSDNSIRFHLAVAMAKSGDISGSKPHFVNAIGDAEADYNIGLILHDQGKLEQAEQSFVQAVVKKPTLEQAQYWLNEIRVEKETKQLLTGTKASHRPSLQAPAGALPSRTNMQSVVVQEQKISPQDVLGIQQTSAQQMSGAPTGVIPSGFAGNSNPTGQTLSQQPGRGNAVNNPFAAGNPWQTLTNAANADGTPGLTPQQLEQLRNQR